MAARTAPARAHELLVATAAQLGTAERPGADAHGYVALQTIPYRAHHLLATAALERAHAGALVLEGGVSSGYFARVLTAAGLVVDGIELDPAAAAEARTVCRNVWAADLEHLDPAALAGPYDLVVLGDTLEHLAHPVPVLEGLRGLLRPGGALVLSVPNVANWSVRLQLLVGRFRYTDRGILDRTHLRFYTERTLLETLRDAGLRPVSVQGAVPVPFVRAEPLARWCHRLGNLRRSFFAYSFVVVAEPA